MQKMYKLFLHQPKLGQRRPRTAWLGALENVGLWERGIHFFQKPSFFVQHRPHRQKFQNLDHLQEINTDLRYD